MRKSLIHPFLILFGLSLIVFLSSLFYFSFAKKGFQRNVFFENINKHPETEKLLSKKTNILICYLSEYKNEFIPEYYTIDNKEYNIISIKKDNLTKYISSILDPSDPDYYNSPIRQCSIVIINPKDLTYPIIYFIRRQSNIGKNILIKINPTKFNKTLKEEFCIMVDKKISKELSNVISGAFVSYESGTYKIVLDELNGYSYKTSFLKNNKCDDSYINESEGLCISQKVTGTFDNFVDPYGKPHIDLYKYGDKIYINDYKEYYTVGKNYIVRGSTFSTVDSIYKISWNTFDSSCNDIKKRVLMKIKGKTKEKDYPYVVQEYYGLGSIIIILSEKNDIHNIAKMIISDWIIS